MADSLVTLTTDFGEGSPYAAAVKGAVLAVDPSARVIDLSHSIPPQDLPYAAYFAAHTWRYFLRHAIHVIVVDPGVGTDRALLYVEADQLRVLAPDNGCWVPATKGMRLRRVIRLTETRYWRPRVSATFHGRDILAPVAGWLARGLDPQLLGPCVTTWVDLRLPEPIVSEDRIRGEVIFADHFGNLITNIAQADLTHWPKSMWRVTVAGRQISVVSTYAEGPGKQPVALIGSSDKLEIAVGGGSALAFLRHGIGTPVEVTCIAT
jgi:S-adenosylmethionine hydrolase